MGRRAQTAKQVRPAPPPDRATVTYADKDDPATVERLVEVIREILRRPAKR